MLRKTTRFLQAEFKQKSKWDAVWPKRTYGQGILLWGPRQIPFRSLNFQTRDSNRLTNFGARYQHIIDELDVKKNEEELKIPLSEVRINDNRKMFFNCRDCGYTYKRTVLTHMKYRKACVKCMRQKYPSQILTKQLPYRPLIKAKKQVAARMVVTQDAAEGDDETKKKTVATNAKNFAVDSVYDAMWKCESCGDSFEMSIRAVTGEMPPRYNILNRNIILKHCVNTCEKCRWAKRMGPVAEEVLSKGQYLGLDVSLDEIASTTTTTSSNK